MKPNKLSAVDTISLLEGVVNDTRSFADRETGLERARSIKDSNLRQSIEEQQSLARREHGETVDLLKRKEGEQIEEVRELFSQRKIRVDKSQIEVRNAVVASIQDKEGQEKAIVQRRFMEAGKARENALREAASRLETETAESSLLSQTGVLTEKRAIASVKGFPSARSVLVAAIKEIEAVDQPDLSAEQVSEFGDDVKAQVREFRKSGLTKWFNGFPLVLQIFTLFLIAGGIPFLSTEFEGPAVSYVLSLSIAALISLGLIMLQRRAKSAANIFAADLASPLAKWKQARLDFKESLQTRHEKTQKAVEAEFASAKKKFDAGLNSQKGAGSRGAKYTGPEAVEARASEIKERLVSSEASRVASIQTRTSKRIADAEEELERVLANLTSSQSEEDVATDLNRQFESIVSQWEEAVPKAHELLRKETESAGTFLWEGMTPEKWDPPTAFEGVLNFGALKYVASQEELALPASESLQLSGAIDYDLPLRLRVPDAASVLLETKQAGRADSITFLNSLVLGWLGSAPAGRLSFTLVDPVGLGESFAGLMHLADYDEILINSRIRTQESQIETRLGELCEHMEKVIQMYLRNDYETITEYNKAAGTIAERYHFLVVADFPNGFSELAATRLRSIATSGARCGVFLLIHADSKADFPQGFQMDDLRRESLYLSHHQESFSVKNIGVSGAELSLMEPPSSADFAKWIHRIGEANRDSNRVEVPFSFIAPEPEQVWTSDTLKELKVPIGRSGATKLQELALGKGTCQHALIAGKTGSGKSTLFHVMITNLALWCDPEEVEFYLIDFKKGVEFKCYADHRLPHARVIAIESDREFGLSVLQRLDQELRHRGELFRAAGVQDVPGYRATEGAQVMPRTLLLIDEFQEFFIEDDQIAQQAAVLLDRIVRQGRAFGIHAVLGSQTLGGAFTLARATLGQMTVRIALACNESDAYLIMDDSNPAPRLLTRPGEGIYNDRAGAVEANSPFQVVWVDEKERDEHLALIQKRSEEENKKGGGLVVFEGNAPGDITQDEAAARLLEGTASGAPHLLLGSPNAIKDPTGVSFSRQSGSNLLFVGPRDDVVETLIPVALRLLNRQLGDNGRLILFDPRLSSAGGEHPFAEIIEKIGGVELPSAAELDGLLKELVDEMKATAESGEPNEKKSTFLFIPSLQRHKKLRHEEDFSFSMDDEEAKPAALLQDLICEGPGWGYHVITSLDSLNNVNRCLGRKAVTEFEKKVLFQMSAADSASLIDSGAASGLGLNRAIFYDEGEGQVEIFRPYAMPPSEWFSEIPAQIIATHAGPGATA